jgi:hypothetical protein
MLIWIESQFFLDSLLLLVWKRKIDQTGSVCTVQPTAFLDKRRNILKESMVRELEFHPV